MHIQQKTFKLVLCIRAKVLGLKSTTTLGITQVPNLSFRRLQSDIIRRLQRIFSLICSYKRFVMCTAAEMVRGIIYQPE